jgi:hypothetical protein
MEYFQDNLLFISTNKSIQIYDCSEALKISEVAHKYESAR